MKPGEIKFVPNSELSRLTAELLSATRDVQGLAYRALLNSPATASRLEQRLAKRYNAYTKEQTA